MILDVGGVGYEVTIPLSTFYDLEDAGAPVAIIELQVIVAPGLSLGPVTSDYATLYGTAPSVVFTASACVPPWPGAFGSLNGNAAACTGPDDGALPEAAG